jgi:hypothetical protein
MVRGTASLAASVRPSLLSFAYGVSARPKSAGVYAIPLTIFNRIFMTELQGVQENNVTRKNISSSLKVNNLYLP